MQAQQSESGQILPVIDGQEPNWMRDVELKLIGSVLEELQKSVYTRFCNFA